MTKVFMKSQQKAARSGKIYPEIFLKNIIYDVDEGLAEVFTRNDWARIVPETTSTSHEEINNMTRRQLLDFITENNLEINTGQRVEDLRIAVQERIK